jgi:2,4-dienoyl-CoA reductase-like NADH-dependent reductase (Old Yellow Enzyme family)/thioredoxin reductase
VPDERSGPYKKLFEPGKIGPLNLRNRLIRASMWTAYADRGGFVTERLLRHYEEVASGGVALVMVEYAYIDKQASQSNFSQLSLAGDEYIPGLARLVRAVQGKGAKIGFQISHAGGQRYLPGTPPKVPSRTLWESIGKNELRPEELTQSEIEEIVEAFGLAAVRAFKAGADLVEVHACHGYLLSQFLSPATNGRCDRYGGSLENRMRLLMDVIRNVREKMGPEFPVSVRLDGSEYLDGGITIEESVETAKRLETAGVDAVHVSGGAHRTTDKIIVPMYWPRGYHVWAAEQIKAAVSVPVIASGSFTTPDLAEQVLQEGKADLVSLARPLLADPFFPRKAQEGRSQDIAPCIRCNVGCQGLAEGAVGCTVNAAAGREEAFPLRRSKRPRRVAVIGGGPAGMEAARVAATMGHDVILFEKRKLGGTLIEASVPEFKADLRLLIGYLSRQIENLGVRIVPETADVNAIARIGAEVVVVAAGARSVLPDIAGIEKPGVMGVLDVLNGAEVGEEVVVVGGGLAGSEAALFLAEKKKRVTIVEMLGEILSEMNAAAPRLAFFERLRRANAKIKTGRRLVEIRDDGVLIADAEGGKETLRADTVVLAVGQQPDQRLYDTLKSLPGLEIHRIGDYAEGRNIYSAIHEAFLTARLIGADG